MPDDLAAYLLLAMNLLVVAALLSLPILLLWWLVGRPREIGQPRNGGRSPAAGPGRATDARSAPGHGSTVLPGDEPMTVPPGERVLRRCDDCGVLWKGRPDADVGVTSLKVRRWMRRRTRAKKADTPAWARRQGWSHCPSCLSANVRTSRAQRSRT